MSKRIEQSSVFAASRSDDQRDADEAFLAKARSRSPKFPTMTEALERRRSLRETLAARLLLAGIVAGLAGAYFDKAFGLSTSALCLIGFTIICFIAGNRHSPPH